ncbi:MAG: murein L,D-transpeptidase catalytic domain family protein [Candidatus Marinimicrobia bacterium]|nr:murein L,D-transpeptidase catalytic domain family protein [Candidatus Neomarinimicrobiota bacterium]
MKRLILLYVLLILFFGCSTMKYHKPAMSHSSIDAIYEASKLESVLNRDVFRMAMSGYSKIGPKKDSLITIIDFSRPSTDKRFYLINLANQTLLYHTYTSHGVNTGENEAIAFSNLDGSRQSSLGFYLTAETYEGKHGISLKLDGLERGFNNRARKRYIVIHSANYVTEEFIHENERLGRSWGCPALPPDITQDIIQLIKEGSVLFIYGNDENYLQHSKLIR